MFNTNGTKESKKERTDIIIAIIVVLFFFWLFLFSGFLNKEKVNEVTNYIVPEKTYDTDGDGLPDVDDLCPIVYAKTKTGCPSDTDGDGIPDSKDKCPEEAGLKRLKGCTALVDPNIDTDDDGVFDVDDECPELAFKSETGCPPDQDGDGVFDEDDVCPEEFGTKQNSGCPEAEDDLDGDGVLDSEDKCPDVPGLEEYDGCPEFKDSDEDGVSDEEDQCPLTAGSPENNGCPLDSDGDGIADDVDRCPNEAGVADNDGCPQLELTEEEETKVAEAISNVQFVTGSAQLSTQSERNLNDLVEILNKYPKARIVISGHTDNVGDDESNLELSKNRANACAQYLIDHKIDSNRISAEGFGETKPIGTNDTADGRRLNRRVEFTINY